MLMNRPSLLIIINIITIMVLKGSNLKWIRLNIVLKIIGILMKFIILRLTKVLRVVLLIMCFRIIVIMKVLKTFEIVVWVITLNLHITILRLMKNVTGTYLHVTYVETCSYTPTLKLVAVSMINSIRTCFLTMSNAK